MNKQLSAIALASVLVSTLCTFNSASVQNSRTQQTNDPEDTELTRASANQFKTPFSLRITNS